MSELNCGIINDLLPLYTENMLSDESKKAVEEHLQACKGCSEKFEKMKSDEQLPVTEEKEVKALKKFRLLMLVSIVGFPLWFPLTVAACCIFVGVYAALWACWAAIAATPISACIVCFGCLAGSISAFIAGETALGIELFGLCLAGAGLAMLLGYACKSVFKVFVKATVLIFGKIKSLFNLGVKRK